MRTCPHCQQEFSDVYGKEYCSLRCRDGAKRRRRKDREKVGERGVGNEPRNQQDPRVYRKLLDPTGEALQKCIAERGTDERAILVTRGEPAVLVALGFERDLDTGDWILL